ncbi:MAG TPA: hypothetical protein VFN31_01575 [Candidatus Saccharimonadales bacterium]|nr:hypothetical protein [Candidatus Saccharimonadales bacterium]
MINKLKKLLGNTEEYLQQKVFINFPQLPAYAEEPLIKYLAYISLFLGLLSLYCAYNLWYTAHHVSSLITYANQYNNMYGIPKMAVDNHMDVAFWLGIVALLLEAYLFFKAFRLLKNKAIGAWDFIYYAFIVNVVYGLIMLFNAYGGKIVLIERLLVSFACLYFLFEIRDAYKPESLTKPRRSKKK